MMTDLTAGHVVQEQIADAMEALELLPPSRERALAQTKLDEAMMWARRAIPPINEGE
jgi:hypothetical protein